MRDRQGGMLAGVCSGIALRLKVDPTLVRVVAVVLTVITGGVAAIGYGLLWVALPVAGEEAIVRRFKPRQGSREKVVAKPAPARPFKGSWAVAAGAGFVTLGLLFVFRETGVWWSDSLVWPLVIAAAGAALIWRQFSQSSRTILGPFRGGVGIALLLGGAVLFLYINGALSAGGDVALAGLVAVIVIGLLAAPVWARSARQLSTERAERIRSEERAEVAAHLHDSVLQTLALIQKNADDSRQVSTLARSQERELRDWLSGKTDRDRADSLAESLKAVAAEVEERHQVPIDAVTVGDRPLDENSIALVAASREAMTNAARHAGQAGPVRLYAEIDPTRSEVFIHDRGPGFDPEAVPADRRGVRDSILGRMEHHGGHAEIRSTPGEGTEVELVMETK
ncbi:MAG TPA: PspC domain-containing protein [Solirubrobacterales bacterium]|nr:PspC domain-containing protein [Solirubrobacterales bacterium]